MKSFETVYKELEYLFIEKLPEYIEKVNKEYNDGIILKSFTNKSLNEDCLKLPNFKFTLDEAEYSEKDRIIKNTILEIKLYIMAGDTNIPITLFRYFEAIQKLIENSVFDFMNICISNIKDNCIILRIIAS